MGERAFDVVVLGAGPAGEVAAGRLGEGGLRVAIVEQHLVGGECSYYACMPSKALLRPGELLAEMRRVPGIRADGLDVGAVLERRDEVIHDRDDSGQVPWLEERGVTLVRGRGRFDGARRVRVDDDVLVAEKAVVVATGSGPVLPPIPGLVEARPWSNREATIATEAPESLSFSAAASSASSWPRPGLHLGRESCSSRERRDCSSAKSRSRRRRSSRRCGSRAWTCGREPRRVGVAGR